MARHRSWSERTALLVNRFHARLAGRGRVATGFVSQPEPRTIGSFARGRQLSAGNFLFAGYLVEAPGSPIWDIPMPDGVFESEVHGFGWLDDLAATGDLTSQRAAQDWTHGWIARYGDGSGPGWTPDLTGRRLVRWINHAIFLLNGVPPQTNRAFFAALSRQTRFLARRWPVASPGLARFEALTGLLYAGLSLTGMQRYVRPAIEALDRECAARVDADGGIPSRNPEELLEVFTLLTWGVAALGEEARAPGRNHLEAIERIAPTLRALRHADGGLARFHGGGRGLEGRLEQALATAGVKSIHAPGLAMGYARLAHGRTTIIADAAPPAKGEDSALAHASTLAMELTSGRRPMVVNCGSGITFGRSWRRAGRATPSHSTLCIEGYSSARLGPAGKEKGREKELMLDVPRNVTADWLPDDSGTALRLSHDGYLKSHGLTHHRALRLGIDGRNLTGSDELEVRDPAARKIFDKRIDESRLKGVGFAVRFHLHPDVDAELDLGGAAVSLGLKSGEVWIFRHDGQAKMTLEASVYLEKGRLSPRATKQIVLSGAAIDYSTRIGWTLSKAQDTPTNLRDFEMDNVLAID